MDIYLNFIGKFDVPMPEELAEQECQREQRAKRRESNAAIYNENARIAASDKRRRKNKLSKPDPMPSPKQSNWRDNQIYKPFLSPDLTVRGIFYFSGRYLFAKTETQHQHGLLHHGGGTEFDYEADGGDLVPLYKYLIALP